MVKCAIKSCTNDTRKENKKKSSITFHRFPKDRNLMKKWIDAVRKTNWEPNIWSKICSVHFPESTIYETKKGLRKLTNDAVPSLFLSPLPISSSSPDHHSEVAGPSKSDPATGIEPPMTNITDTPRKRKLKKEIVRKEDIAKRRRLRCNALYAANRRLKTKIEHISQVLNELKRKRLINQEQVDLLEVCGASAAAFLKRLSHKGKEYPPELRTFALTLHFYSPKAYSYVRSTFNTCLPHPSTIRKCYQCVNASPGFTEEAFKVLDEKVKSSNKKILCNLVIYEMSIRQLKDSFGQEPCSNHLLHLLRAVIQKYVAIRVKYLVRKSNVKETKRQLYNKLTHFKGQ